MTTALMADAICRDHLAGRAHPESPERYDAVMEGLKSAGLRDRMLRLEARDATENELLLCHTAEYLKTARRDVESGRPYLSTGDTDITPSSWRVAARAAGGVLNAVDAVLADRTRNAFCAVRPPGHHANAARGMGFCFFNNVAIAARYAQSKHGVSRVLIVDWDVHHGNGTQDIFYRDPSVFFFSTHQWPLYPGTGRVDETGEGPGEGTTMNFPFPAGSGRREILGAVENHLLPAAARFQPDLVLISAGFDSRVDDPLGRFTLTDEDFADLTRAVMGINGRVVSMLEGGYNLAGLASASAAHVAALLEG
ncbi:MAG: histone deacetylase [Candidatus Solibacter sp.]|nr:histone deacetylase [Candidatus Solibacter sp.]